MPRLLVTMRDGEERELDVAAGQSLMAALRDNGIDDILAICGGCCSCATCHIYVSPEHLERLPPMNADESDMLDASSFRRPESRLSCQILVTEALDGLTLRVAPED